MKLLFKTLFNSIIRFIKRRNKMSSDKIPLTKLQKEIMAEFYAIGPTKVIYNKNQRKKLWDAATKKDDSLDIVAIAEQCPALAHQIQKSYETNRNIQSAVFSECAYAQTLANMLQLKLFVNCTDEPDFIPSDITKLLHSYNLSPRYVYSTQDKKRMLIQAGGCNGIDSALISVSDLNIYTIEFKEPGAKTSEPDLPKYDEDGVLKVTDDFLERYPQFEAMLKEQENLNFFDVIGSNVHDFSSESINIAVSNNYTKKYADVICTEDTDGVLVMLPANQVTAWAEIEGEIRPAGRNHYNVWTPNALQDFLTQMGATIADGIVEINLEHLELRRERGGDRRISGYKINPLFFVYADKCEQRANIICFNINDVRQLNPTIAGKMFFTNLKHNDVAVFYMNDNN